MSYPRVRELDEANEVAKSKGQAAAMVSASALRVKLAGLLTDRVEVTNIDQEFDSADTLEDIAAATAHGFGYELAAEDRTPLGRLLSEWHAQGQEQVRQFLASCNARPVQQVTNRRDQEAIERKRLGLPLR